MDQETTATGKVRVLIVQGNLVRVPNHGWLINHPHKDLALRDEEQWDPVRRLQPITVTKEVKGNIEAMAHWAGEGVGSVKSILPAAKIVRQLADEAEKLLHQWT